MGEERKQTTPLDNMYGNIVEDLRKAIESIQKDLYKGINEFLAGQIDLTKFAKMLSNLPIGMGMPPQYDYYQILGLNRSASDEEVKQRFRDIMMKVHPDKGGKELNFLAQLVNMAYKSICIERGI